MTKPLSEAARKKLLGVSTATLTFVPSPSVPHFSQVTPLWNGSTVPAGMYTAAL